MQVSADDEIEIEAQSSSAPSHRAQYPLDRLWTYAQIQSSKDPRFSEFFVLHQFNILRLEHDITQWHTRLQEQLETSENNSPYDLDELSKLLRQHTQAVKDFDYVHHLKDIDSRGSIEETSNREDLLQFPGYQGKREKGDKGERGDQEEKGGDVEEGLELSTVAYKTFAIRSSAPSDLLLNWVRTRLWKRITWSKKERKSRSSAFTQGEDPELFSISTRLITSLAIAIGCAAIFVVPIVLMTIPKTVSVPWSLTTLSVAILVFGACAALLFGPEPSTRDVVASTAAYAAVLVVFYGNIVNNLLSKGS